MAHRRKNPRAQHTTSHQFIPPFGGVVTISLNKLSGHSRWHSGHHSQSVVGELDMQSKLGSEKCCSDTAERMEINVAWEPVNNALAIPLGKDQLHLDTALTVVSHYRLRFEVCVAYHHQDASCIDYESLLVKVVNTHSDAILNVVREQLLRRVFSHQDDVSVVINSRESSLQVRITPEEVLNIAIDSRTGRFSLRDSGNLAAAGRGPRFSAVADRINEMPNLLIEAISKFRYTVRVGCKARCESNFPPENFGCRRAESFIFGSANISSA